MVQTIDCRCHLRQKYKVFNSGEPAGHAVGPPRPVQCCENTLFKNSQTVRRKCDGVPCYVNHKWIIVCRLTSCNSSIRTIRRKEPPLRRGGSKYGPKSLVPVMPASRINADILNIFFNNQGTVSTSECKLLKTYVLATFLMELWRSTVCSFGRAI